MEDVAALVELSRDPALHEWASSVVDIDADGTRWVQAQQQRRAAGDRFDYAVFEAQPGSVREQLVGNVVLKEVTPANRRPKWATGPRRTLAGGEWPPALWRHSPAGPSTPSKPPVTTRRESTSTTTWRWVV
ncbi:GNAT family N-acetyltransferase [Streptomyces gardneri]|uniref:GNAT family N-acetyltransferase n=1 Tax=Streptomyces gardneri TaxID=66892 RepID=UPI0035DC011A